MKSGSIWFVVLTFHPNEKKLNKLIHALPSHRNVVIKNDLKNLGYAGGMNEGIRYCLKKGAKDWIVILNQDLSVSKIAINKSMKMLQSCEPGIAGPFAGELNERRWTTIFPSENVSYISGSCIAIHRDMIEKIGGFYEPYFMYYEDADICTRAKKAGFPITHIPVEGIVDDDPPSLGKDSFLHQYYLARNHLLFVERNAPIVTKLHEFIRLPKSLWEHWKKGETGGLAGIRDYFTRRFGQYEPL